MSAFTVRVADTVPAVAKTLNARRKTIAAAQSDPRWNNEYRTKLVNEANDKARADLVALRDARDAAVEAERASIARARTVKSDPNVAILAQLQGERAWARTVRRLDAVADVLMIVQEAGKEGNRALLDVLSEEVPAYLESRSAPRQQIDGAMAMIARAVEPLKSDAERQADAREAALQKAEYVATLALGHAEHELETGQLAAILPLADGSTLTVGAE